MALPANITTVTVSHKHTAIGGAAMSGTVTWSSPVDLVDASAVTTINISSIRVSLDIAGAWSATVPIVDDPDAAPSGWAYTVTMNLTDPLGQSRTTSYLVQVTAAMAPAVDWSALTQLSTVTESSPYGRLTLPNTWTKDQTFDGALRLGDPATLPATDPTGGGTLYADNGALLWRTPTGVGQLARVIEGPLSLRDPRVGALLDGTNESAKLATAISLLPAGGGEIYVPTGTLGLGAEVTLPDNCTLRGSNFGASIIKNSGGYSGRLISTGGNNHVSHLQFTGTAGVTLLTIREARSMFSNLHFVGGTNAIEYVGTSTSTAHANKMTDINIEDCLGYGIFLNAWCYDNEFLNTWIGECNVGIRIQDGACFFNTLHVWGCTGNGIEVRGFATLLQNVYLETNGVGGAGNGIDIFNAEKTQIIGGRLWKNASNGANVGGASNRTRFSGLDIHENGGFGISGSGVQYCQVTGCQFYDLAVPARQDRPIATAGTSDFWVITGNVMRAADHVLGAKTLVGAGNVVANNIE